MTDFEVFSSKVHAQFTEMSKDELYTVDISGDTLYELYLSAFPEGTNPIYKERTEHDCSCCKNFIRNIGLVVSIQNNKLVTVWDVADVPFPYDVVAKVLADQVRSTKIASVFRSSEPQYGAQVTRQLLENGQVKNWNHFHGKIATKHYSYNSGEFVGRFNTMVQTCKRGFVELTQDSLETIQDLIKSKALYRGEEHARSVEAFAKARREYFKLSAEKRDAYLWQNAHTIGGFRNSVIGTLAQDLSAGVDLETAVRSFEVKVAPANYKRPTALITPRMIEDAMKTIEKLGLESALDRRHARLSDVSINNVLWADGSAKAVMKNALKESLLEAATSDYKVTGAIDISIDEFVKTVLPKTSSMELFVKNSHQNKFVSVTAPAQEDSGKLFKWNNDFGWSYDGNITDSIKERVKKAGGNVNADFRVSLSWFNYDDLDIHAEDPHNRHIYFANKVGILDVDMNAGGGQTREPVENLAWNNPPNGKYKIWVNQYSQRETNDVGFTIEVENRGNIEQYSFNKSVKGNVQVSEFVLQNGVIVDRKIGSGLIGGSISQEKWGVKTEAFAKVQVVMNSPNHWDDNGVGNKHWFFILENCKNDQPTRGIYNEFLNSALDKHRKVFEVVGDKTKCQPEDDQLSGLGFSSTQQDSVVVRVKGSKLQQTYNVIF